SGTTCFVDTNVLVSLEHLDAVAQAVTESGMRAVLGRGVFDQMPVEMAKAMGPELSRRVLSTSPAAALDAVEALPSPGAPRVRGPARGRIAMSASVYGLFPYCSDGLFAGLRPLAARHGVGMVFHMASSIEEAQAVERRTGVWPITQLDRLGVLGPDLLLTHCA